VSLKLYNDVNRRGVNYRGARVNLARLLFNNNVVEHIIILSNV
jgi:hypothetical protein